MLKIIYDQQGIFYTLTQVRHLTAMEALVELAEYTRKILERNPAYVVPDPELQLALAVGQLMVSDVYGWAAWVLSQRRIDELLSLQEQQLRAVGKLTALYVHDIDLLRILNEARTACGS
jgi:hypothetical protein